MYKYKEYFPKMIAKYMRVTKICHAEHDKIRLHPTVNYFLSSNSWFDLSVAQTLAGFHW
jgi:hypothetical protein